ncbi:hypothetical protein SBOR_5637 [Sclerotinia borealis F-4128]|uniref:RING-type domain-containing protein n=1 Tax=Sclerotinia borealis (strain F-4128) TaxID=1432307 RepID=W9CB51_SCLBF|nr:hypothetical protein SBOR_5637 [Sclerotinia borealis F-4128]
MPLLNRIRESFRALAISGHRDTDERNNIDNVESCLEEIPEETLASSGHAVSSDERISGETDTLSFTIQQSRYYEHHSNTEVTEDARFDTRPDNPDFEDVYANDRSSPNLPEPLPELPEGLTPYLQHIGGIRLIHPQYLPHDYPHRRVHVYGRMFLIDVPNLAFEDIARETAIERALVPTADMENDSCAICQDPYDLETHQPVKVPVCGHILGKACIMRWLEKVSANMTCPMCRKIVEIPPVHMSTPHMRSMGQEPGNLI